MNIIQRKARVTYRIREKCLVAIKNARKREGDFLALAKASKVETARKRYLSLAREKEDMARKLTAFLQTLQTSGGDLKTLQNMEDPLVWELIVLQDKELDPDIQSRWVEIRNRQIRNDITILGGGMSFITLLASIYWISIGIHIGIVPLVMILGTYGFLIVRQKMIIDISENRIRIEGDHGTTDPE